MVDAEVAEQIAVRFDLGADPVISPEPVARGEQGRIWRLDTDRGSWAVKEAFRSISAADAENAAAFSMAARAAGICTPLATFDRDGRLIAEFGSAQFRVLEWIDLLPPDPYLDPVQVGRTLAVLHRTAFEGTAPLDEWFTEPVGAARWQALDVELTAAGAPFAGEFSGMRAGLIELDSWVVPPRSVRTCHRDLWADNLLTTPSGGVCVIDWDDCGLADPGYELGCALFEFGGAEPDRIRALYDSYRWHGGPGRIERAGDLSMLICQLGHICEIACRDWLDPAERSTDRQHNAARFREFVERPVNPEVLNLILESVQHPAG